LLSLSSLLALLLPLSWRLLALRRLGLLTRVRTLRLLLFLLMLVLILRSRRDCDDGSESEGRNQGSESHIGVSGPPL
jgi:hypothetical protein